MAAESAPPVVGPATGRVIAQPRRLDFASMPRAEVLTPLEVLQQLVASYPLKIFQDSGPEPSEPSDALIPIRPVAPSSIWSTLCIATLTPNLP